MGNLQKSKADKLLLNVLGPAGAGSYCASMNEKREKKKLGEEQRKISRTKPLVGAPRKKTKFYPMRKEDIELFRAMRGRMLLSAIGAIDGGASPNAVYHHPAEETNWSFCQLYEGKTALQIAVLEQSFEPNEEKAGKLRIIIDFLEKR